MSRLLLASFTGLPDRFCAYRRKRPVAFAAACGFVVAAIGVATDGEAVGIGHHHTHALLASAGTESQTPFVFTGLKFLASWISSWAGVPAGMFGPSLSIGAGLGADVAWLFDSPHTAALIALGMCGFLAGVTQTPITAMIIVMEMTDGHSMVLSLITCALLASGISRMISRPLYGTLAELMMRSWRESPSPDTSRPH
jgi:H+/Cl- antiporter ClcA